MPAQREVADRQVDPPVVFLANAFHGRELGPAGFAFEIEKLDQGHLVVGRLGQEMGVRPGELWIRCGLGRIVATRGDVDHDHEQRKERERG